jgi:transcriptional regulator with XRE-family HTH domain
MAKEEIPVTPRVISWARKRAGFTLEEATEKFAHIEAWEAGKSFPTYPQLERMADEFRLPIAVFFFLTLPMSRRSGSHFVHYLTSNLIESHAASAFCSEKRRPFSSMWRSLVGVEIRRLAS